MKKLGGDLAGFEKKRNTDHAFPPPFKWAENDNSTECRSIGRRFTSERVYLRQLSFQ